jgi:hypothetical protein
LLIPFSLQRPSMRVPLGPSYSGCLRCRAHGPRPEQHADCPWATALPARQPCRTPHPHPHSTAHTHVHRRVLSPMHTCAQTRGPLSCCWLARAHGLWPTRPLAARGGPAPAHPLTNTPPAHPRPTHCLCIARAHILSHTHEPLALTQPTQLPTHPLPTFSFLPQSITAPHAHLPTPNPLILSHHLLHPSSAHTIYFPTSAHPPHFLSHARTQHTYE